MTGPWCIFSWLLSISPEIIVMMYTNLYQHFSIVIDNSWCFSWGWIYQSWIRCQDCKIFVKEPMTLESIYLLSSEIFFEGCTSFAWNLFLTWWSILLRSRWSLALSEWRTTMCFRIVSMAYRSARRYPWTLWITSNRTRPEGPEGWVEQIDSRPKVK